MKNPKDLTAAVSRARAKLAELGYPVKHTQALSAIAAYHGFSNREEFLASIREAASQAPALRQTPGMPADMLPVHARKAVLGPQIDHPARWQRQYQQMWTSLQPRMLDVLQRVAKCLQARDYATRCSAFGEDHLGLRLEVISGPGRGAAYPAFIEFYLYDGSVGDVGPQVHGASLVLNVSDSARASVSQHCPNIGGNGFASDASYFTDIEELWQVPRLLQLALDMLQADPAPVPDDQASRSIELLDDQVDALVRQWRGDVQLPGVPDHMLSAVACFLLDRGFRPRAGMPREMQRSVAPNAYQFCILETPAPGADCDLVLNADVSTLDGDYLTESPVCRLRVGKVRDQLEAFARVLDEQLERDLLDPTAHVRRGEAPVA